jgi:hypothetical protein
MAAGQGFKTFTTGEVLTAADVNGYLMQGVLVFASAAARNAAITSPQEGQFAFTKDTNGLWYYDGAAWVASGATGDIEGVTAGVGISGGGTSGTVTITNSMATEITASGDIIVGTGSSTFDNLPIGTTGQVLTADTTVSPYKVKWATPSTGASFVGANATKTANQSIANVTITSISFDGTDIIDTNGFHDPSTNNSRMTIPTGYGGKYLIQSNLQFAANVTGGREVYIRKNGSTDLQVIQSVVSSNTGSINMSISGTYALVAGDYVEIRAYQSSGGSLDIWASNSGYTNCSSFQITYLGA